MSERTHCPRGHPYDDANTERYGGKRSCRECHRAAAREYARAHTNTGNPRGRPRKPPHPDPKVQRRRELAREAAARKRPPPPLPDRYLTADEITARQVARR